MTELPYWFSFLLTLLGSSCLLIWFSARVRRSNFSQSSGKNWFSGLVILVGLAAGLVGYPLLVKVFQFFGGELATGHAGIAYFSAGLFNLVFALLLVLVGRVIIDWERF